MKQISLVYQSGYCHTNNLAKAVLSGIDSEEKVNASPIAIDQDGEIETAKALVVRVAKFVRDL